MGARAIPSAGVARIDIMGDAGGFLRRWAKMYPDFMDRSIRHVAYLVNMRMKMELLGRVPGGEMIPDITKMQHERLLGKVSRRGRRTLGPIPATGLAFGMNGADWPIGGKLAQTIRYTHRKKSMRADIGWLSKGTIGYGKRFQEGETQLITPKMRRLFAVAGIRLKKGKTFLRQPPRPVFEPFFRNRRTWIENRLVERMGMHIRGEMTRTVTRGFNMKKMA